MQAQQFNVDQGYRQAQLGMTGLGEDRAGRQQRLAAAAQLGQLGGQQQRMAFEQQLGQPSRIPEFAAPYFDEMMGRTAYETTRPRGPIGWQQALGGLGGVRPQMRRPIPVPRTPRDRLLSDLPARMVRKPIR